jgi:uncharacterized protein (TIGR03000 family)
MMRWSSWVILAVLAAALGSGPVRADYQGPATTFYSMRGYGYGSGYNPQAWGTGNMYPSFSYAAYPRYGYYTGGVWEDGVGAPAPYVAAYHFNPLPNFAGFRPEQQYYSSRAYTPEGPYPETRVKPNVAIVEVRLPASAELWIEGDHTQQMGNDRFFVSPSLVPGKRYVYHVKAIWADAYGRKIEDARTVDVSAGKHVTIRFPARP